ncbi:hypothetical protein Lalb_Chr16g0384921 [Lupinus albus]|uniref:Plastid movement impaired protein n=1 Tax=Lupinus albus TaxID=3870 RepID=A0A6A4P9C1_LUPAL|nr:hypothetical protein Lalb_Chr16g0384921 [Lupinus albus]
MGNTLGSKKTTKVMQIDGKTLKLKTPVKAGDVLKNHPGLVLLESESVKHYGTRAKPLEAHNELQAKRLYFLVELPKVTNPRRVRSGINMSAKDRLESLMLTRRSASDLSIMKQTNMGGGRRGRHDDGQGSKENDGGVRLKMRLPKEEVEKLIQECKDEGEVAERIVSLYMANGNTESGFAIEESEEKTIVLDQQMHYKGGSEERVQNSTKPREKRVSFMPINQGGIQVAVAS